MSGTRPRGFTLLEIIIALGLLLLAILTVCALSLSTLTSHQKASDTATGQLVASQVLDQEIQGALNNTTAALWGQNSLTTIYETQTVKSGVTSFVASVYVSNVTLAADPNTGIAAQLKRVEVAVNWWDSQNTANQGYGKLEARAYRMIYGP